MLHQPDLVKSRIIAFPDVFVRRAKLSRELGVRLVKLTAGTRERIYLDELDPLMGVGETMPAMECGLLCYIAEQKIVASARSGVTSDPPQQ